jgi:hypothetical protein
LVKDKYNKSCLINQNKGCNINIVIIRGISNINKAKKMNKKIIKKNLYMKCTGFPLIIQFYLKEKTFEEKLKRLSNESLRHLGLKVLLIINGISINHNKSDPNLMIRMAN